MKINEITASTTVFVDMDGVLADLFNHVGKIHDVEHYTNMKKEEWEAFFQDSDAEKLFASLPMFANANELLAMVKEMFGGYKILSSPLNYDKDGSIKGKKEWLQKHIIVPADDWIFDHEKYKYAMNGKIPNILIDDYRKNIHLWEKAGGIGIKWQNDEDTLDSLKTQLENKISYFRESLPAVHQK